MALYFAYGSNLLAARLRARCPSARVIGAAQVAGFTLAFDKIGQDGSGKATLVAAPGQVAHGALFDLADAELAILDEIEGLGRGYDRCTIRADRGGKPSPAMTTAMTYIAPPAHRRAGLAPFDWYLGLVLTGAHERDLPQAWTRRLRAARAVPDPVPARPRGIEARALLAACPPEWQHG